MQAIAALNGLFNTYRPGSYVTWTADDLAPATSLTGDRTIAIIGEAEGGVPLGAYVLTSPSRARALLRGGPLLEAVLLAFTAAGQNGLTVVAVNVLGGTQATLEVPAATGEEPFATLTSSGYRERANQLRAQIYGTPTTGYTVTLTDADSGYNLSGNRVGLGLQLQYRGAGTAATAEVKVIDGVKHLVTTVTGADDGLSLPLTSNVNLNVLARSIQASGPYFASTARDGRLLASDLDVSATPLDIKAAPAPLTAIKADFVLFLQTSGSGEVTLTLGAGALPAAVFAGAFAGGKSTPTVPSAWPAAMQVLSNVPAAILVPLTGDPVVLAGLRADNTVRNNAANAKFTTMIGGFDDTLLPPDSSAGSRASYTAAVVAELSGMDDPQFQLITNTGTTVLPGSGQQVRLPMYLFAAMLAGEIAGAGIDRSVTYRYVAVSNPFPALDLAETDAIVRAGGLVLELPTAGGTARIVRDRTTYSSTDNPVYESGMSVRIMNSAARGMKALQDRYIPGEASAKRLADFQSAANDYFDGLVENGYLVSDGLDEFGQSVQPYSFTVQATRSGGRHVISRSSVVPKGEFTVGEHAMSARSVEFQLQS